MNYLKKIFQSSESGVTLILVLMLVAGVGLLVIPVVYVTATGLRGTNLSEQRFNERYAVDAGVEDALWRIKYDPNFPATLSATGTTSYTLAEPFNGHKPDITIRVAKPPAPSGVLPPRPYGGSQAFWGYSTIDVYPSVSPDPTNLVPPDSLDQWFEYTLVIENFGGNPIDIDPQGFGDCLPPGFVFRGVVPGGVKGFTHSSWGRDLIDEDLLPQDVLPGYLPPGPRSGLAVGGNEITPNGKPEVYLTVDQTNLDPVHPCPPDPVSGEQRWQVQWDFGSPLPTVPGGTIAWVKIIVEAPILAEGTYYNDFWWTGNPTAVGGDFTCETDPVYARIPALDITSSAGGTKVNVRAENKTGQPITIRSWQVDDGTSANFLPDNSMHVGRLCDRGVAVSGSSWQAQVPVEVHDEFHDPVDKARVSGTWSPAGSGPDFRDSCTTDATGRCQVNSGNLSRNIATGDVASTFTVDPDGVAPPPSSSDTYFASNNHNPRLSSFTVYRPGATSPPLPPTVTDVSPNSGSTAGGPVVTITGTGFVVGATVSFGGTPATGITVGSATSITATPLAHGAGPVDVVVTNPDSQSSSLPGGYMYLAPPGTSIHVGDLDGFSVAVPPNGWAADVTITVHDVNEVGVQGVLVTGEFSQGNWSLTKSCTTLVGGTCIVSSGEFPGNSPKANFTVTDVAGTSLYVSADNHDADGHSNGTAIKLTE